MALDFLRRQDQHGSAIYLIHDGSEQGAQRFSDLALELSEKTKKQISIFSADSPEGRGIIQFYMLKGMNFVVVVRDDDQLHHVWTDGERFDASQIAYTAEQAG